MIMAPIDKVRGVIFGVFLFLSSYFGIVFMPGWFLPVAFFKPNLYRQITDTCLGWWMWFVASLMEVMFGIRMVITGDALRPGERSVIIMNHRSHLDWMYFWSVLARQSGASTEKIILKYPLKHIPGAGWAMQCGAFMFLKRKWEYDQPYMRDMIDYFAAIKHHSQVLIFPEGTDYGNHSKCRSDDFARKNNLPFYDYVLHPRTTGFSYLIEHMKHKGNLDVVYDVSVGYPYGFPQTELDLIMGKVPPEVHFHMERIEAADLPDNSNDLSEWCKARWHRKEAQLKQFYTENKKFTSSEPHSDTGGFKTMLYVAFVYWLSFLLLVSYLLVTSWWAQCWFLAQSLFFFIMSLRGGFEHFQAKYTLKNFFSGQKSS